eukprot:2636213-Pleurochrysis_carterae.AAC.2
MPAATPGAAATLSSSSVSSNTANKTFIAFGLTQSEYDPCLFYMIKGNEMLIVLLYVDDIVTAHTRGSSLRNEWAKNFSSHFRWTDFSTSL